MAKLQHAKHNQLNHVSIKNALAMRAFGAEVARSVLALPARQGATVIALTGDLGAGKTTFAQGFLKELGVVRRIISPTFLIVRPYTLKARASQKAGADYKRAFHIDCYRLKRPEELLSLGFKEMLSDSQAILLIEWPELIAEVLPPNAISITITHPETGTHRDIGISQLLS